MKTDSFVESGVDRSIGFLLLGLGVAAFIMLTVLGMGSVQRSAEHATAPTTKVQETQTDFPE